MTNSELIQKLDSLILSERKISDQIIQLIQLADSRKIYLEEGYGSLLDWLTRRFKYSASAAYRRIQTARLLKSLPEQNEILRDKIQSGALNITALAKVQSFIKEEEKRSGEKVSSEVKAEILGQIENQPIQVTEKILFQSFPEACVSFKQERVSAISDQDFRVSVTLSEESLSELKRVQELLGHALPESSLADVISYLSKDFLKRRDPLLRKEKRNIAENQITQAASAQNQSQSQNRNSNSLSVKRSNHLDERADSAENHTGAVLRGDRKILPRRKALPNQVGRFVFQRDRGQCQYKHPRTGEACGSRWLVEVDHVMPLALGGEDRPENLRCLCRNHNQWRAKQTFQSTHLHQMNQKP